MNSKLKQLVDVMLNIIHPLKNRYSKECVHCINQTTTLRISPNGAILISSMFSINEVEIITFLNGKCRVSTYSDFDDSNVDQLIIDLINFSNDVGTKETLLERLKKQKTELETKIKALENEN